MRWTGLWTLPKVTEAFGDDYGVLPWPRLNGSGLSSYLNAQSPKIDLLFMGAAISILPLLILFVFLQRYIVQGVEQSGING